jgi:pyrroloquinoline quinone (PQQ) biosynthesis protein C
VAKMSASQFGETVLDTFQEFRWGTPTLWDRFCKNDLTREGALVYGLEHCVFADNFPRWLANVAGNCPYLEVRKYLIENMYVEEVRDPTIIRGHYESLVDFVVALGADRDFVLNYKGAPITRMRIDYCDYMSRTRPWIEGFTCVAGNEVARGKEMIKRVGDQARSSRGRWAKLNLPDEALAHWDAADEADSAEGGHGDMPLTILKKYANTEELQQACLETIKERQAVNRIWGDQIGAWAYEASGLKAPSLDGRQPRPRPVMSKKANGAKKKAAA